MSMAYSFDDLRAASTAGLITATQRDSLIAFLGARPQSSAGSPQVSVAAASRFQVAELLWYAGALVVMSAMGLFSTLAFSQMGGGALTATALVYAVLFLWAGHHLWTVKNLRTPGGLLIAVAVSMAPLAVYGIQDAFGMWGDSGRPGTVRDFYVWIKGGWIFMEIATIAVAALALRFYRFPFIVMLPALALWFMSMDIVPLIFKADVVDFDTRRQISIVFGLAMIAVAVVVNARQRSGDFAYWLYLFGVVAFWGALTATSGGTPLGKALYCAINVGFLFFAVFLGRAVFAVFGTIGIAIFLGDLANKIFEDSLLFPFALSLIGIGIIALGLYYHRHQDEIYAWFDGKLPDQLRRLRPRNEVG